MKWLFLSLLLANGLVWVISDIGVPGAIHQVAKRQTLPRVASLKVADATSEGVSPAAPPPDSASVATPVEDGLAISAQNSVSASPKDQPEPTRQCIRLGWFDTAESARGAYQNLGGPGELRAVREQERSLEPLHWVIIPPQPDDRALKLFNELQRRGIDSYLVTRGENTNAISLGLFQSREAADRVLEAKKRQNLNAVLATFPRNQISYALVFEVASNAESRLEGRAVRDYRKDFDLVEISRCEGIATTSENP